MVTSSKRYSTNLLTSVAVPTPSIPLSALAENSIERVVDIGDGYIAVKLQNQNRHMPDSLPGAAVNQKSEYSLMSREQLQLAVRRGVELAGASNGFRAALGFL